MVERIRRSLDAARRIGDVHENIDARQTAFDLNGLLLGLQCCYLMEHKDRVQARSVVLTKLASLATDKVPASAFDSVKAWRKYLEGRHE